MLFRWIVITGAVLVTAARPEVAGAQSDAAQANNPLASITAFNVQGYYIGEFNGIDEDATQLLLRYATPFSVGSSNWLVRATMPFNSFPAGPNFSSETGPGDIDVFATYLFDTGNPAVSFGIGPQVVLPTASPHALGSEQWQLGLANVYFNAESAKFQYGYLAIYRAGIGDTNGRERVSLFAGQPFAFIQMGNGWYTGAAPVWTYDFESGDYSVPLGARIGRVWKRGGTVFNAFAEPQVSVLEDGPGQPDWQIFLGLNMQFTGL